MIGFGQATTTGAGSGRLIEHPPDKLASVIAISGNSRVLLLKFI